MRAPIGASNHGALFLHDDDDRTGGAKPHVIGGPLELRVLALDLCEQPRRDDARPGRIMRHRRRALLPRLEMYSLPGARVRVPRQPTGDVSEVASCANLVE